MSRDTSAVMVFPGQGSQFIGMCDSLEHELEIIKTRFETGSKILDVDLWKLIREGPQEKLNETQFTQPAMLASDVAFFDIWQKFGGKTPKYMAGHSLGEYAALVCADILDYEKAMSLVIKRARLMQKAVPQGSGSMAAVLGLDAKILEKICLEASTETKLIVSCANFNTDEQIVISGNSEAVGLACSKSLEAGAKRAVPLEVSVPSHCNLMKKASELFGNEIEEGLFDCGDITVIQNVDANSCDGDQEIREALIKQFYSPVRWVETIQTLIDNGCTRIYECGPGKVLAGLAKRINRSLEVVSLNSFEAIKQRCQ